ncbi:MAG: transketolase [Clostridia bacterium]|nr:transketolase [Clostridia bacterium]
MAVTDKCVDAIRVISAEGVDRAKSGHPGICMGAAPIAFEVYADFLNFSYKNPKWDNRDRFVLSAGHGSMMLYTLLHMFGFGVTKEDLMNFRQLDSKTPGHPEIDITPGVETSTGPLGQGIGNAVGFAVAEAHLAAIFNRPGYDIVDHYTYVLCGDGCLEEGISYEACSFAGVQKLGKLILLYDRNGITIEGDMTPAWQDDVPARFCAMGWQVIRVPDANNLLIMKRALMRAKAELNRPTIIICNTTIGYGAPNAGTAEVHGAPLGPERLQQTKDNLGWTEEPFTLPEEVSEYCRDLAEQKLEKEAAWNELFAAYEEEYPELAAQYRQYMEGYYPDYADVFSKFDWPKPEATRNTGSKVLNGLFKCIPNLMSGSADLSSSTKTEIKGQEYFSPEHREGVNIHFGIREHAMAAICNGITLHGGLRVCCSTFFTFSDYMKGGLRMSALMNIPVLYIFTHDSIGVGEDGPTHQPMEQLISLRAIPNLKVFRPADGKETVAAYVSALSEPNPTAICLTRQNLPQYENSGIKAIMGGYVLSDSEGTPDVLLIATGSEVELCMKAQEKLEDEGIAARVVSMPCIDEFEKQTHEYKESVIPSDVKARVCVEAASVYSWYKYAGDYGEIIAMNTFGISAPAAQCFEHFGFTVDNVVACAKKSLAKVTPAAEEPEEPEQTGRKRR